MRVTKVAFLILVFAGALAGLGARAVWLETRVASLYDASNIILGCLFLLMGLVFSVATIINPNLLALGDHDQVTPDTTRRIIWLANGVLMLAVGLIFLLA